MNSPTACLIVIGNEILSGRTQDTNVAYIGHRCDELGISLCEVRVIADDETEIVATVNHCRQRYEMVFTTGGIGPTHDDITTASLAKAFSVKVFRDPEAVSLMQNHYDENKLNDARLNMADVPEGAQLIENPVSGAPGYRMDNVYVMAGVPAIMQAMFESLAPGLTHGDPVISRTVPTALMESRFSNELGELQKGYQDVSFGSYPFVRSGRFGVNIVLRSSDKMLLQQAESALRDMLDKI